MPDKCPFCQLLENPKQTLNIYETENFKAFLDINPRARGHTMIVPKEHHENLEDIPPGAMGEIPEMIQAVINKAKKGLGADGASVVINSGDIAGQRIPHIYIQVFPRFEDDENAETPAGAIFQPLDLDQQELKEINKKMNQVDFQIKGSGPSRKDKINTKDQEEGESSGEWVQDSKRGAEFQ